MEDEVRTPLLGSCQVSSDDVGGDKHPSDSEYRIRKPKRKLVVEPVLILFAVSGLALQLTMSLFTYRRFQDEAAQEMGVNMSTLNLSQLMKHCSLNKSSEVYILSHIAQTKNSYFNIVTGIAKAVPNLISAIFLGPYSDKAGRKYAIVIPLIGTMLYCVVCLVVTKFNLSVWYLVIGNCIDGLGGRYIVLLVGCFSYIADITSKADRHFRITIVEFLMFLSAVLGPVGVGYWIQHADYFWPITASAACLALNVIYSVLFIPETIIKDPSAKFFTIKHLKDIVNVYTNNETERRRCKLSLLYLAFVPVLLPSVGDDITTLFLQNPPLCWQSVKIGNYSAISTAIALVGGAIFAKLAKYCMQIQTLAFVSVFSSVVRNIYNAFVMADWMMYVLPALTIFSYLAIPTLRSMMSNLVHSTEQGSVFASIALSEVIFGLVGNITFSTVYANTIAIMPGFVYFVMAGFYAIATAILLVYVISLKKEKRELAAVIED